MSSQHFLLVRVSKYWPQIAFFLQGRVRKIEIVWKILISGENPLGLALVRVGKRCSSKKTNLSFWRGLVTVQGAQTLVHLPQKPPITKTCIFWCKITWGTMFTKVILLPMVESIYWFWKKTFWLLNKVVEGRQIEKSWLKTKCGKNMV